MKKIFIAILSVLSGLMAYGQEKGDMYVSGTFRTSAGKGEKVSFTDVTGTYERTVREAPAMVFSAEFGYFITHNCALRSAVSYGLKRKSTTTISRDEKSTVNAYAHFFFFSPAVSYYARICDKFYYRPGAVLSFGAVKEILEGDDVPELAEMPFVFGISFEPAAFEVRPIKQMGIILKVGACDIQVLRSQPSLELRLLAGAVGLQFYF